MGGTKIIARRHYPGCSQHNKWGYMEQERPDPELLLRRIAEEEHHQHKRGKLKIFFGYAAGVGKTYAMLEAAHAAKNEGKDVVVGYVEPHARPETEAQLVGLECLPPLQIRYQEIVLAEFDTDATIERKPELVLVDEMAHSNARGCRHEKRYQDIQELLRHGIDVYTTVNVQHVESLNDVVESITGIAVRERVPDSVFDSADQVELVDIEPQALLERLGKGKIYREAQAQKAMHNFFVKGNLEALREIALRRTADIVNKAVERHKTLRQKDATFFTSENILVCLSSSPSNPKVIRTAARMADALHGSLTALFVETPGTSRMSEQNRRRLNKNIKLAEQLGAKLVTVEGDDVPFQVAEFAKTGGIAKIVIGRSGTKGGWLLRKRDFIDKLTELAPNLDIYVIPNQLRHVRGLPEKTGERVTLSFVELGKCAVILTASTAIGLAFDYFGLSEVNVVMAYLLGVLIAALVTTGFVYGIIYSLCSVLVFNFFFTAPRLSFQVYDPGYPVTFAVMVLVTGIISTMTKRIKQQNLLSAQKAYRMSLLLEASQRLTAARDAQELLRETAGFLLRLLKRTIVVYPSSRGTLQAPVVVKHDADTEKASSPISTDEKAVAAWVFKNGQEAGVGTCTLPGARCLYVPVQGQEGVLAVVAVAAQKQPLDVFEKNLVLALLNECALALEKEQLQENKNAILLAAKQEALRANLLRGISHDLRTPLTSIAGNANLLLNSAAALPEAKKQGLYADIYDDAVWLSNLVENILAVSRLDDGSMGLRREPELITEIIHEALVHNKRRSREHIIHVAVEDPMLMAQVDAPLIVQVLINLMDNAIKHTPPGSHVTVEARRKGNMVEVRVCDNGEGIPEEALSKLFDMFFTVKGQNTDGRRGIGLGLSLCRSIVTAHGGAITVANNIPHGTVFSFTLPLAEVFHA